MAQQRLKVVCTPPSHPWQRRVAWRLSRESTVADQRMQGAPRQDNGVEQAPSPTCTDCRPGPACLLGAWSHQNARPLKGGVTGPHATPGPNQRLGSEDRQSVGNHCCMACKQAPGKKRLHVLDFFLVHIFQLLKM